ncbi:hypothetical protein CPB85DRAFT_1427146 [Mucidula mucida]|nr:hypothetical protein CPB85DRAFT_1427146 [Mucidula mucida]
MLVAIYIFFKFALMCVVALDSRLADSEGVPVNVVSRKLVTAAVIPTPTICRPVILVNNPSQFYFILCIILLVGLGLQLVWFIGHCFLKYRDRRRYGRVDEDGQAEDKGDPGNGTDVDKEVENDDGDGDE